MVHAKLGSSPLLSHLFCRAHLRIHFYEPLFQDISAKSLSSQILYVHCVVLNYWSFSEENKKSLFSFHYWFYISSLHLSAKTDSSKVVRDKK